MFLLTAKVGTTFPFSSLLSGFLLTNAVSKMANLCQAVGHCIPWVHLRTFLNKTIVTIVVFTHAFMLITCHWDISHISAPNRLRSAENFFHLPSGATQMMVKNLLFTRATVCVRRCLELQPKSKVLQCLKPSNWSTSMEPNGKWRIGHIPCFQTQSSLTSPLVQSQRTKANQTDHQSNQLRTCWLI